MNKDLLSGLVLLLVAGVYYQASGTIAESTLSDEVGAAGLPRVLVVALVILAGILIVRSLAVGQPVATARVRKSEAASETDIEEDARLPRALGFLVFGALYVALLPYIGYIAGVALLIGAVSLYEGAPRRWTVPAAAIFGAVLYWAIFVKLLGVNQPVGSLFRGLFS